MGKIKKRAALKKTVAALKKNGKIIVFTNGCFDIIHPGHVKYLARCKRLGHVLVVGLNTDSSVRRLKGRNRPVMKQGDRAEILSALEAVDYVTFFNELTPEKLIRQVAPHVLAKGGDWKAGDIAGADFVRESGGRVRTVPFVRGYSTSRIIKKIKTGA